MDRFKTIKIFSLIAGIVLLVDVSGFAKGNGTTKITEQKNEGPTETKQKLEIVVETKNKDDVKQKENKKDSTMGNSDEEFKTSYDAPENPVNPTGKVTDIAGFKFNKFITDKHGQTLYMCVGKPYNIFIEIGDYRYDEDVNKGTISFLSPLENGCGGAHINEHNLSEYSVNIGWYAFEVSNTNDEIGMNAYTTHFDKKNNIIKLDLDLKGKSIVDEEFVKKLCDVLNGKGNYAKTFKKLFDIEKFRVMSEMHGHQYGLKDGGTGSILVSESFRLSNKEKFDLGGYYNEVKNVSCEDAWKFFEKYVAKGTPTLYLKFKDMEQAKKSLAFFKKYYFDYKTEENCKSIKPGKNKIDDDFIKFPNISKEYAETTKMFELGVGEDGNKETKKAKNLVKIKYDVYDFDDWKKECIGCYNEDYLSNLPKINELNKKYGFKGIKILKGGSNLLLSIYTDNRKVLTEEKLKEIEKEIVDIIIGYIDRNEIKFEDLINAKKYERIRQGMKENDFCLAGIAEDVVKSYILEGKPFSKKYFRFNEKGELENNPKVFEKYCKENYTKILKEALEKTKRKIYIYEREDGEYDVVKDFVDNTSCRYLPLNVRPVNGKKNFDSKEEFAIAQGFVEEIIAELAYRKWRGEFYSRFMRTSLVFNRFDFFPRSELDIKNFERICKKDLKVELKNLKLDDSYLNKKIDIYKNILKKYEKSLVLTEKLQKEKIQKKRDLLNKKEISFKDIRKSNERPVDISPLREALVFVKLNYSEKIKLEEKFEELYNEDIKVQKIMQEVHNKTKNKATSLDKKTINMFKKCLKTGLKVRELYLNYTKALLEKIRKMQKIKVNLNGKKGKLTPEYIKAIIKNVEVLDYDKVNKEEKKKDLEQIKKLKKKYRNKGIKQIEREALKH